MRVCICVGGPVVYAERAVMEETRARLAGGAADDAATAGEAWDMAG
jgi:hypothetical protein